MPALLLVGDAPVIAATVVQSRSAGEFRDLGLALEASRRRAGGQ